ncbi:hypothetical protein FE810_02535 [Thalassotalea litorea]|uniref:Uncharacterized protein n=1 Tax=Thalassotalea litorea TaxID=2020715 RepID=A0A5R9IV01_9GAMM|nr:hypothetical protein [Thalassotalea litorea]TLU67181.1 hypothetical protein FE810_02535 [Thalassotalea litorea]
MKKLTLLLVLIITLVIYISLNKSTESTNYDVDVKDIHPALSDKDSIEVFPFSNKKFASQKLKELTIANAQCKERKLDFNTQVNNIHQILIQALEHELRNGKTRRDLLAYSNQYKPFYDSYDDLLLQAKINLEKEKYDFTTSVDILNEWNGLSVINNFSVINIPIIVLGLQAFEGDSNGLSMGLVLDNEVSKSDVFALLENDENFNTYLESPLEINGSRVLSPSILFALTGGSLNVEEFKQAVSLRNFNVNDVAIAVMNDLPYEYLEVLIAQAVSIEDMPIIAQGRYDSNANLADFAASAHNVKLLQLLETYGVHPTNELGIITGLDIAIMNLPDDVDVYANAESFPDKYLETINYLIEKGYKAHGSRYQMDNEAFTFFKAPANKRNFQSSKALIPELKKALHRIDLADSSNRVIQILPDDSLVSKAIESMELKKAVLSNKSKSCESIQKELLAEEGFLDHRETYDLITRIAQDDDNTAQRLHDIDPTLVNLWRDTRQFSPNGSRETRSDFITMLGEDKLQEAFDYSSSTPLTEFETDRLLLSLLRSTENIIPIWNARSVPTPPSGLLAFKHIPFEKWESLEVEKFDFSIKDKFGNDLFVPAALNSQEAVQLLLDLGLKPEMDKLGLDVLDLLLEDSYENGSLNKSLRLIVPEVEELEPSHYSRIARLKKHFPEEYEKLIQISNQMLVSDEYDMNKFRSRLY